MWKVLANPVVLAQLVVGEAVLNYDQWDGYPEDQKRLLDHIATEKIDNVVAVTGDLHLSAAGDVRRDVTDPGSVVVTEFVGTSISSDPGEELAAAAAAVPNLFDYVYYVNAFKRGYVRCTVTPEQWTTEYRTVDTALEPTSPVSTDATFVVDAGVPGIRR